MGPVPILIVAAENATLALPPAVRVTEEGEKLPTMLLTPVPAFRPLAVTTAERLRVPAKEPVLVSVRVATAAPPLGTLSEVGAVVRVKSREGTTTLSVAPPVTETE